jgi:diguanylate cyclase (GGDEF)-like protein/PAS domain S-box-containing protein
MREISFRKMKAGTLLQISTNLIIFICLVIISTVFFIHDQQYSNFRANSQQYIWQISILIICVCGLAYIVISILYLNLIGKPLQKIREKSIQIAQNESILSELIEEPMGVELRDLTYAINSMSLHVKKYTDEVEEKVTERTRLLEEGSRLVQEVLDTTPNLLCIMNTEIDQFNYVNREYADYFGVDCEEMLNMGPTFIRGRVHPNDKRISKEHENELLKAKDEEVIQSDFRMANANGEWRWVSMRSIVFQRNRDHDPKLVLYVGQDITELKNTEEKLRYLSIHDQLTGLYNRLYFEEEIARLERGRIFPISTIVGDVDNLKCINDTYGHAQGDEVLKTAAQILRTSFRAEDVVARMGGDEFIALLPSASTEAANRVMERIQEKVQLHPLLMNKIPISISLGAATIEKGQSLSDALKLADDRMYLAKQQKKNQSNRNLMPVTSK